MSQTARELGVTPKSLYSWVNAYSGDNGKTRTSKEPTSEEVKRLKKELARVKLAQLGKFVGRKRIIRLMGLILHCKPRFNT